MRNVLLFSVLFLLAGCAAYTRYPLGQHYGVANSGCFDAPCQLQRGSYKDITREASKQKVYDAFRPL